MTCWQIIGKHLSRKVTFPPIILGMIVATLSLSSQASTLPNHFQTTSLIAIETVIEHIQDATDKTKSCHLSLIEPALGYLPSSHHFTYQNPFVSTSINKANTIRAGPAI